MIRILSILLMSLLFFSCGGDEKKGALDVKQTKDSYSHPSDSYGEDAAQVSDTGNPPSDTGQSKDLSTEDGAQQPDIFTGADSKTGEANEPDIDVDPTTYSFTASGQTTEIHIMNVGNKPLILSSITWKPGSSASFSIVAQPPLEMTLALAESTQIRVRFKGTTVLETATLTVGSNDPDEPFVDIYFTNVSTSKGEQEPCIELIPNSLNFGTVERGKSKSMTVDVKNCGPSKNLVITKIERSQFFFFPLTDDILFTPNPQLPLTIPPNQISTQTITFAPTLAGSHSGYFRLYNNDPSEPQAKLDILATGVPPPLEEIGLHIELEWSVDCSDVDLHLIRPGSSMWDCTGDCHFGNMHPDWGVQGDMKDDPFLDYDDVDGYGPEHTNLQEPDPGLYKVVVHLYDTHENDGSISCPHTSSPSTVRIYFYNTLAQTFGPIDLLHTDHNWDVCTIEWPSKVITPLGNMYDQAPTSTCFQWP